LLRQVKAYRGPLREIGEGDTILRKIALDPKTLAALPRCDVYCRPRNGAA